jgi:hypothetical protein
MLNITEMVSGMEQRDIFLSFFKGESEGIQFSLFFKRKSENQSLRHPSGVVSILTTDIYRGFFQEDNLIFSFNFYL